MTSSLERRYNRSTESNSDKTRESDSLYECSICYNDAVDPVVLKCGHFYCWECINKWLTKYAQDGKRCPICKVSVKDGDVIPIYGKGKEGCHTTKRRPAAPINTNEEGEEENESEPRTRTFDWATAAGVGAFFLAIAGAFIFGRHTARSICRPTIKE